LTRASRHSRPTNISTPEPAVTHFSPIRSASQPWNSAPIGYSAPRMNVFTASARPRMSSPAEPWLTPANVVNAQP